LRRRRPLPLKMRGSLRKVRSATRDSHRFWP
jgi:hypothetical protein